MSVSTSSNSNSGSVASGNSDWRRSKVKAHEAVGDAHLAEMKTNMESSFYMYEMPQVEEVMYDPVDEVVVEDCCPASCYRVFPCCQGDPDSPVWQEWYKHRLQISRYKLNICSFLISVEVKLEQDHLIFKVKLLVTVSS